MELLKLWIALLNPPPVSKGVSSWVTMIFGSFDLKLSLYNDFFIVYKDPVLIRRESNEKIFFAGLQDYKLLHVESKENLQKGQIFTDGKSSIYRQHKFSLKML